MKILLHVNYVEGPGDCLEQLFKLAKRAGCDGVELRWKYRFPDRTQAEYQALVADLKQRYPEMEIVFGGGVDFCRDKTGTAAQDERDYVEFLQWAKKACGSQLMNFFCGTIFPKDGGYGPGAMHLGGSGIACETDYERAAAGLRRVGDAAAACGIRLALETHNGYIHDVASSCAKLMAMTDHPAVGINYDHGNIILNKTGESIDKVFELLPDKIYYAHLKNMMIVRLPNDGGVSYSVTRLDSGYIDQSRVMRHLKERLVGGIIAIEYPCPGDGVIAALRDMEYIRFLKNELDIQ